MKRVDKISNNAIALSASALAIFVVVIFLVVGFIHPPILIWGFVALVAIGIGVIILGFLVMFAEFVYEEVLWWLNEKRQD